MKKKVITLLLAGVMAACLPATAFAAEETETASDEVLEVTMDMMDPDLYDGTWVPFEAGFDLYLPTDWNVLEVSEENAKNGMIFLVSPQENAEEAEAALSVQMNDATGAELADIAAGYEEVGFTGIGFANVNGIDGVIYDDEPDDLQGVSFLGESGSMYTIIMAPAKSEEYSPIWNNILFSLSPSEAEEEAATE